MSAIEELDVQKLLKLDLISDDLRRLGYLARGQDGQRCDRYRPADRSSGDQRDQSDELGLSLNEARDSE